MSASWFRGHGSAECLAAHLVKSCAFMESCTREARHSLLYSTYAVTRWAGVGAGAGAGACRGTGVRMSMSVTTGGSDAFGRASLACADGTGDLRENHGGCFLDSWRRDASRARQAKSPGKYCNRAPLDVADPLVPSLRPSATQATSGLALHGSIRLVRCPGYFL
jgi:hypothetical protein